MKFPDRNEGRKYSKENGTFPPCMKTHFGARTILLPEFPTQDMHMLVIPLNLRIKVSGAIFYVK